MKKLIAFALVLANVLMTPVVFADSSLSPTPESDNRVSIAPEGGPAPEGEDGSTGIILPVIAPELIPPDQSTPIEGGHVIHTPPPPKPPHDNGGDDDNTPGDDITPGDNNPGGNNGGGGGGGRKKKPVAITANTMPEELRAQLLALLSQILALRAAQLPFISGVTTPVIMLAPKG